MRTFGGKKEDIKVIGIRHGEKMYETLLTKEECAKAEDMGNFYRVPADNRGLNYDKFFKEGDTKRSEIEEFNSNNTYRLNLEETKAKIVALDYIKKELSGEETSFNNLSMKILVTGAKGFVGRNLCAQLNNIKAAKCAVMVT